MKLKLYDNTKHKYKQSLDYYKDNYSEYFIEKYPNDYFSFGLDIGAVGGLFPWHINHMASNNKKTIFFGFEPNDKSFKELTNYCKSFNNTHLYKDFFGRNISLKNLFDNNNLNINDKWFINCDCEGDEKYIFLSQDEINIAKKACHLSFELHPKLSGISYIDFLRILNDNFSITHKIIRTFHCDINNVGANDNSSFIIVEKDTYKENIKKYIEYFHKNPKLGHFWSPYHNITFIN